jgi:fatty-acyl-CoA synthase
MGIAFATWTVDSRFAPGHFVPSPDTRVLDDGRVARRGNIPLGYYKDPERSALTFPTIDGERWSVPGDYASIEADGSLRLFGRGTSSINTAGEKVWPEEVEAVLKELPQVADIAIVGVPDDRFGEAVAAVIVCADGASIDEDAVIAHVKQRLASYKAPRHVLVVPSLDRLESGKIDHRRWKQRASELLGRG